MKSKNASINTYKASTFQPHVDIEDCCVRLLPYAKSVADYAYEVQKCDLQINVMDELETRS